MSDAPKSANARPAPWRGRKRVPNPKNNLIAVRCTTDDHALIDQQASRAGLSVSAYLRHLALGTPGPRAVRRPPIERAELARLLGHVGKIGSNVNQLAKRVNMTRNLPSWSELASMQKDIADMRAAIMKALNRDH